MHSRNLGFLVGCKIYFQQFCSGNGAQMPQNEMVFYSQYWSTGSTHWLSARCPLLVQDPWVLLAACFFVLLLGVNQPLDFGQHNPGGVLP
jgi:hypothetical protein